MATQPLNIEDCRSKLDPQFAEFLLNGESRSVPLDNVKELRLGFTFSTNDNFDELDRFVQQYAWPTNDKPKRYVEDFDVRGVRVKGLWRLAFTTRIERLDDRRQREFLFIVVLRRGFSESLDWTEALIQDQRETDGNGVEVAGIDNTASLDRAKILTVTLPNIAPDAIGTVLAAIPSVVTGVSVQGVALTDEWHRAFAVSQKQDDGTSAIQCVLTRNRFTVELYQAFGTPGARTGYRIYDVPRSLEDGIKTAWQGTGRSADSILNLDRDLCVVTLWMENETASDYSHISAANCAFFALRYYYDNQASIPETPEHAMGITYTASFQQDRASGLYSGWIEKRVRQTLHVGLHPAVSDYDRHVQREVWSGVYKDGANYQKAVLSIVEGDIVIALTTITELAATVGADPILPLFSTDVPAQGEAREWSLSPNDDCTFDVTRTIDTEREVATAGRTTTVDAFSETLEKVARGMSAGGDDIVELDGTKIKLLRWEQDKYGKFTKQERELTPVPADTGWVEYPDRHGASYYRWFRNQTMDWIMTGTPAGGGGDPPAVPGIVQGMDDTTSNSLSVSTNAHTLYDGVATRQAFGGSGGYGTFTRSTRDDARTEIRYRDIEYTDNLFKTKIMVPHKAKFTILKRSAVTASYTDADNALTAYWQLSAGDYADAEMVSEPKASMVSDPDGRRGIRVEVVFQKQITDWIRAGDPF